MSHCNVLVLVTNNHTNWISLHDNFKAYMWPIDHPFLCFGKYRNGIQQRRNSFEDGVFGTTCPIPPGRNFTYMLQVKDQIGSFYYFPSLAFHKAAGGFGGIRILSRPRIPVPFPDPAGDYTVLIGDWYKSNHTVIDNSFPSYSIVSSSFISRLHTYIC